MTGQAEFDELSRKMLAAIFQESQALEADEISMYSVGDHLGLQHDQAQGLAMDLAGQGLLEIKSLTGKVELTEAGRAMAQHQRPVSISEEMEDDLEVFIEKLAASLPKLGLEGTALNDLELDLDVLRGQLRRTKRLSAVLSAIYKVIKETLDSAPHPPEQSLLDILTRLMDSEK